MNTISHLPTEKNHYHSETDQVILNFCINGNFFTHYLNFFDYVSFILIFIYMLHALELPSDSELCSHFSSRLIPSQVLV